MLRPFRRRGGLYKGTVLRKIGIRLFRTLLYALTRVSISDPTSGYSRLRASAAEGNTKAQYGLGVIYAEAFGGHQYGAQAAAWYRKAAGTAIRYEGSDQIGRAHVPTRLYVPASGNHPSFTGGRRVARRRRSRRAGQHRRHPPCIWPRPKPTTQRSSRRSSAPGSTSTLGTTSTIRLFTWRPGTTRNPKVGLVDATVSPGSTLIKH